MSFVLNVNEIKQSCKLKILITTTTGVLCVFSRISFCPTDTKFATCSDDGTVRVWDFLHCNEERILRGTFRLKSASTAISKMKPEWKCERST